MKKKAVYPGTFDPLTFGHLDIIKRGSKLFDTVTILLAKNRQKNTLFTLEERIEQIKMILEEEKLTGRVNVDCFQGLLVDYCKQKDINIILRGLRPMADFDYEFEMAMTNRGLNSSIETVFITTDQNFFYLRSSLIKDIAVMGGDISSMVPSSIEDSIKSKLANR